MANNNWGQGAWGINNWGDQADTVFTVTGLSATTSQGSVTTDQEINEGWGRLTWGENAWGIAGDIFAEGQSMTVSIGSVTANFGSSVIPTGQSLSAVQGTDTTVEIATEFELTGVAGTLSIGSTTEIAGDANVSVTGISTNTNVGSTTIDPDFLIGEGWGRGTWGNRVWGGAYTVIAQGQSLTTAQGTAVAKTDVDVSVTGLDLLTITQGLSSIQIDNDVFVFASEDQLDLGLGSQSLEQSTNESVTNSAPNFQFTAQGNAALSTDQFKFGTASLELDGTDDFVETTTNLDLSSTDFTIDVWIRPNSVTGYKGIWQSGTSTTMQSYLLGNQVYWTVTPSTIITSSVTVNANEWTMLSYERQGNTHRIYKNGTLEDTATTANKQDNGPFSIGENGFGDFNGYIDEFRVSDIARYGGSSFTEPTSAFIFDTDTQFLLHFDGPDGSTVIKSADDTLMVGTFSQGQVVPENKTPVDVTGISASLTLGSITLIQTTVESVTGQSATLTVGQVSQETAYPVTTAGLLNTSAGSVTVIGTASIPVSGIGLTANIGSVNVTAWSEIDPGVNNVWTEVDFAA